MECDCKVQMAGPSGASCAGSTVYVFMMILENFLRRQCDIEDPCGQFDPLPNPDEEYDFIVVGGGTAGCVVANRLSEVSSWKVLLVEAGMNEPTISQVPSFYPNVVRTSIDWQYQSEPEEAACLNNKDQKCAQIVRGKVIGGTSALNAMNYVRGSKVNFDDWENAGNEGWAYDKILPYFIKSENNLSPEKLDAGYHGKGGYLPVSYFNWQPAIAEDILQAARELGYDVGDVNGEISNRFDMFQSTSKDGVRYSTARAFLRPVKNRPNLHIMLNTTVTKVLVDKDSKTAYGVEVAVANQRMLKIKARKEIVVSGGSLNSPQILLLSGIGDEKHLKEVNVPVVHNLPGVGRNLNNHVAYNLIFQANETATNLLTWETAMEYMLYRTGPMSGNLAASGYLKTKYASPDEDRPDIQLRVHSYTTSCSKTGLIGETEKDPPTKRAVSFHVVALAPESTGVVSLKSNNPFQQPKIVNRYLTVSKDVLTVVEGIKAAVKFSKAKALKKYGLTIDETPVPGCEGETFGKEKYWMCAVRRNTMARQHQVSTCKMGPPTDPVSVVNAELKVHGIQGLRVMDASIMPSVPTGNIVAPTVMIAEKGCDMIKKQWLKPREKSC